MLSDFTEAIYALCMMSLSLNENIAAVLFLLGSVFILFFRKSIHRNVIFGAGAVLLVCRVLEVMADGVPKMFFSGLGIFSFMIFFPGLLIFFSRENKNQASGLAFGLSLALLLSVLNKTVNSGASLLHGSDYLWINGALAVGGFLFLVKWFIDFRDSSAEPEETGVVKSGSVVLPCIGLFGILILIYFGFGSPSVLVRWVEGNYAATVIILSTSILTATALVLNRPCIEKVPSWIILLLNILFLAAMVITILIHEITFPMGESLYPLAAPGSSFVKSIPFYIMIFLSPVIILNFLLYSRELLYLRPAPGKMGLGFLSGSFILLLMIFFHIFTTTYDYIPVVGPFFSPHFSQTTKSACQNQIVINIFVVR
jgi:hypothetical protein